MKKVFITLAAFMGLTLAATAQNPGQDNGLGLKISIGSVASDYGCPEGKTVTTLGIKTSTEYEVSGALFGFALDNRWYVWHNDRHGIAVNAHWLDLTVIDGDIETTVKTPLSKTTFEQDAVAGELGFLGVGPMYTFYLGNQMALDGYYNLVPTAQYISIDNDSDDGDETTEYIGFGFTHNIGAAFRWRFLQAGFEFRIGEIELENTDDDVKDDDYDAGASSFKAFVGFKF